MPVSETRLFPGPVSLRFAEPITVEADGGARDALALAHRAVTHLLPEHLRPLAVAADTI
jgi:hypothetical protein